MRRTLDFVLASLFFTSVLVASVGALALNVACQQQEKRTVTIDGPEPDDDIEIEVEVPHD